MSDRRINLRIPPVHVKPITGVCLTSEIKRILDVFKRVWLVAQGVRARRTENAPTARLWSLSENAKGGTFRFRPSVYTCDGHAAFGRAFHAFSAVITLGAASFLRNRNDDTLKERKSHLFNSASPS